VWIVDRGYLLRGGGFINVICGWQNWLVKEPIPILFNILPGIFSHILPLI